MKAINYLKVVLMVVPFLLTGCKTKKAVVEPVKPLSAETMKERDFLLQVGDNAQYAKFVTSKVKFSVKVGTQKLSLTGNLKMKRDDCIRLQLMAFGFVEAGRIELTPDYVLIMDRINKQYMKATYSSIDFLRNSGLNFYSMQALFWNELFVPGQTKVTDELLLSKMDVDMSGDDAILSLEDGKMQYRWLATKDQAKIRQMILDPEKEARIRANRMQRASQETRVWRQTSACASCSATSYMPSIRQSTWATTCEWRMT